MGLNIVAGFKALRKSDQRILNSNLMEVISHLKGGVVAQTNEDGVVRIKIVLKKQDLKQMLKVMRGTENFTAQPPPFSTSSPFSLEQRLNLLRRRHLLRMNAAKESCCDAWCPVLQSIPE